MNFTANGTNIDLNTVALRDLMDRAMAEAEKAQREMQSLSFALREAMPVNPVTSEELVPVRNTLSQWSARLGISC